jgi:hypothetical protein
MAGSTEARPPVEWTAAEAPGKQRVVLLVVAVVVLIVALVMMYMSIDFAGLVAPE